MAVMLNATLDVATPVPFSLITASVESVTVMIVVLPGTPVPEMAAPTSPAVIFGLPLLSFPVTVRAQLWLPMTEK